MARRRAPPPPDTAPPTLPRDWQVESVELEQIRDTRNVRLDPEADLDGLAQSVDLAGLAQLPVGYRDADGRVALLDGARRCAAARTRGLTSIPVIIRADAPAPAEALMIRLVANEHRRDLDPRARAAALKLAWYVLNATVLGCADHVNAALDAHPTVLAALPDVRAVLDAHGFQEDCPPVSQAQCVERLGLGMTAAALRKAVGILALDDQVQTIGAQAGLTAAGMRALARLAPADQGTLLTAMQDDPMLAKQVRAIVTQVQKGRPVADAIALAQGRIPGLDAAAMPLADADAWDAPAADADTGDAPAPAPARAAADDPALIQAVIAVIDAGAVIQSRLQATGQATLPEPWRMYLGETLAALGAVSGEGADSHEL